MPIKCAYIYNSTLFAYFFLRLTEMFRARYSKFASLREVCGCGLHAGRQCSLCDSFGDRTFLAIWCFGNESLCITKYLWVGRVMNLLWS